METADRLEDEVFLASVHSGTSRSLVLRGAAVLQVREPRPRGAHSIGTTTQPPTSSSASILWSIRRFSPTCTRGMIL